MSVHKPAPVKNTASVATHFKLAYTEIISETVKNAFRTKSYCSDRQTDKQIHKHAHQNDRQKCNDINPFQLSVSKIASLSQGFDVRLANRPFLVNLAFGHSGVRG